MAKRSNPQSEDAAGGSDEPNHKGYEKVIARWTRILGVSTVALVLATGISAYFLFTTEQTINKQVDAAGIQLRAYVNFQQLLYAPHFSKDSNQPNAPEPGANIGVTWKNFGSTPAREATYWISVKWYDNGTEPDFSKPSLIMSEHPNITLSPGGEIPTALVFIPMADITKMVANKGKIFLWGDMAYKDYIPGTPIRHSHFCMYAITLPAAQNIPAAVNIYRPDCNYTD